MFQSTRPRGERHTANHGCLFWEMFQSTLPRGERHQFLAAVDDIMYVSIHAPAWGATKQNFSRIISLGVSIHAPAWGATGTPELAHKVKLNFNPRSRVGSDEYDWFFRYASEIFQSTLPRGERHAAANTKSPAKIFQSTLPRGERHCSTSISTIASNFNPRSRVGSDRCRG